MPCSVMLLCILSCMVDQSQSGSIDGRNAAGMQMPAWQHLATATKTALSRLRGVPSQAPVGERAIIARGSCSREPTYCACITGKISDLMTLNGHMINSHLTTVNGQMERRRALIMHWGSAFIVQLLTKYPSAEAKSGSRSLSDAELQTRQIA